MVTGIIGRKVGMTQVFDADGTVHPGDGHQGRARASSCRRRPRRPTATRRCSSASSRRRRPRSNKPTGGPLQEGQRAADARAPRGEARDGRAKRRRPATRCSASIFANGERVDVIGTSRGKGFQGVVKRHHFAGGAATHGSMFHRAPGSIGASSFPSRVVKGMRAAGRMGGGRVTMHNLKVLQRRRREPPADRRGRHSRRADRLRDRPQGGHGEEDQGRAGREAEEGQEVGRSTR